MNVKITSSIVLYNHSFNEIQLLIESIIINNKNDDKYKELISLALYDPLKNIKEQILLLGKIVGFTTLNDIIYLSLNINNYLFEKDEQIKYDFLSRIFVPLDYNLSDSKEYKKSYECSKIANKQFQDDYNFLTFEGNSLLMMGDIKNSLNKFEEAFFISQNKNLAKFMSKKYLEIGDTLNYTIYNKY